MKPFYKVGIALIIIFNCGVLKSQSSPQFTVTSINGYTLTCSNPSLNLIASSNFTSGPVSYSWASNSSTFTTSSVTITMPGNYTVTASSGTLTNSQVISVTVNTLFPVTAISPTFQNITCNPASITGVTASVNMNAVHQWMSPQNLSAFTSPTLNSVFIPGSPGTYTHVATNPVNGCSVVKTFTVASNSSFPSFSLTSSSLNFSLGCGNTLTVVANGQTNPIPGGAITFTLLPPGSSTVLPGGALTSVNAFTLNIGGTYTMVVRDMQQQCDTKSAFTVVQNTLAPVLALSASSLAVCAGNTVAITANGVNTSTFSGGISNGVAFTPATTTAYTVVGTNSVTGCVSVPVTITITVNPLPAVSVNASSTLVCIGGTVNLSGAGATNYSWSGGVINNQVFSPIVTSTYIVTGINAVSGCSNTSSVLIVVNQLPNVSASASSPTICTGNTVTLSGTGAATYSWTGGAVNNIAFSPQSTGTYTVTGTDVSGCTNTAVVTVSVSSAAPLTVLAADPVFCSGMTTTLNVYGANSYTWSGGITGNALVVSPIFPTVYSVTGTDSDNCISQGHFTLNMNTATAYNYTVNGFVVSFSLVGNGCSSFIWDFGNQTTSNINYNPVVTYTAAGTYGVCLKCTQLPDACTRCINIVVPSNTMGGVGLKEESFSRVARVFPNPAKDKINVEVLSDDSRLLIFDNLGRLMQANKLHSGSNTFDLNLKSGMYFYQVFENGILSGCEKVIVK